MPGKEKAVELVNQFFILCSALCPFESQGRVFFTFDQNFDFKIRRDHQKNFFEPRAYESVDVRSLFWVISHRSTESNPPRGSQRGYIILYHMA